jgi:hypothetical protein
MFPCRPIEEMECKTPSGCSLIALHLQTTLTPYLNYIALHSEHSRWMPSCICVCGHANLWSHMKPSGMDTARFEPEVGSRFDVINQLEQRGPKTNHGSCIQSAPKSLTPASKLASWWGKQAQACGWCIWIANMAEPRLDAYDSSTQIRRDPSCPHRLATWNCHPFARPPPALLAVALRLMLLLLLRRFGHRAVKDVTGGPCRCHC